MKQLIKLAGVAATLAMAAGQALAAPCGAPPLDPCTVPEPNSASLILLALAGVGAASRYFKKK